MKTLGKLFLEILLMMIGVPTFVALFFVGIFYTFLKHLRRWDYSIDKQATPIIRSISLIYDCLANAGAGELLNDVLKVKENAKIKYGKFNQTISAVTGLRFYFENTDNRFRRFLDRILGKGHCVDAISKEDKFYHENNK